MSTPLAIAIACVFVQVGLTLWAIVRTGQVRLAALKAGEVKIADIAVTHEAYPHAAQLHQANVRNQFETPILLYAAVAIGAATGVVNWGMALGAVGYMVTRFWHRIIHVGRNHIPTRFRVYLGSLVMLGVIWVSLGLGLILGGG